MTLDGSRRGLAACLANQEDALNSLRQELVRTNLSNQTLINEKVKLALLLVLLLIIYCELGSDVKNINHKLILLYLTHFLKNNRWNCKGNWKKGIGKLRIYDANWPLRIASWRLNAPSLKRRHKISLPHYELKYIINFIYKSDNHCQSNINNHMG